jgi:hypothetical protein
MLSSMALPRKCRSIYRPKMDMSCCGYKTMGGVLIQPEVQTGWASASCSTEHIAQAAGAALRHSRAGERLWCAVSLLQKPHLSLHEYAI